MTGRRRAPHAVHHPAIARARLQQTDANLRILKAGQLVVPVQG